MRVRFGFSSGAFSNSEREFIVHTLNHKSGWVREGHSFVLVQNHEPRDVVLHLQDRKEMRKLFPQRYLRNLSVTDMRKKPFHIHIDYKNWENIPESFEGSMERYRQYLIQHEMGHILGHDHRRAPPKFLNPQQNCPVMMQQTKGTRNKCRSNPWGGADPSNAPPPTAGGVPKQQQIYGCP